MPSYTFDMDSHSLPDRILVTINNALVPLIGKRVTITVNESKKKRTLKANAFYWSCIVPHVRKVRADLGDPITLERIHEELLAQFAPSVMFEAISGIGFSRVVRSSEMTTKQMADYCDAIIYYMGAFGYPVLEKR